MLLTVITVDETFFIISTADVTSLGRDTFSPAVEAVFCNHSSAILLVIPVNPCTDHSDSDTLACKAHTLDCADGTQLFNMVMKV